MYAEETTAQPALSAAQRGPSAGKNASQSASTGKAPVGTAGIAAGTGESSTTRLSDRAVAWAKDERRISRRTLERLPVASGTAFYPDAGARHEGLFFRYPEGWKARSLEGKHFVASKGFKLAFWNIEAVLASEPETVWVVEGELDACALVESGIEPGTVLSVPNGAKERPADNPQEVRGYDYVTDALAAGLSGVKRFVWCGDTDGPGRALREDMARLLGVARFWFVEWPDLTKDANDMLRIFGPDAVRDLVTEGSLPWPVAGLYRLSELPEPSPMTLWNPGFAEWGSKVRLAPRNMSVVTGHPGHGKTVLWNQIWFQVVRSYAVPMCIASFETRPKPHIRRQLRTLLIGELERNMTEADIARADEWINDRYLFVVHPDNQPTLKWFLDIAEVAVVRHGARIIQIDPWNRLEGGRDGRESETDYIGRCLRTMHAFAHDMNCHVQILAHPAKMDGQRRGQAPGLEDISGSKNWENMVDQGFVVHRPEIFDGVNRKTEAHLYHRKARFEELGFPCKLKLDYDVDRGSYRSLDGISYS